MDEVASWVDRFEQAWQEGPAPDIDWFLSAARSFHDDPDSRRELLLELVLVDLELRWRSDRVGRREDSHGGRADDSLPACPTLEDYVARFPELGPLEELPVELIGEEYRVRTCAGEQPSHASYMNRFPMSGESLREELRRVDREIAVERETADYPRSSPLGDRRSPRYPHDTACLQVTATSRGPNSRATASGGVTDRGRLGDYQILEEVARGAMGIVYRARQMRLNRIVALKTIRSGHDADEDEVQRFRLEAEAAANLDHPHIVPVYEVGQDQGVHFLSMAYVEGVTLAARLADGPLPPREAVILVAKVAEAVQFAHDRGVIHRDLKPGNILVDASGEPRITDFGLAKQTRVDRDLTATGQVLGTPSYMPPEQALGKLSEVGPLSDVYALGAVLFALVTGQPPFRASSIAETLHQVVEQPAISPRRLNGEVPVDVATICLKCLDKDPGRRYLSAGQLADELRRFLRGEPILARPVSKTTRLARWCRRNPLPAVLLAAVCVSLLGGSVVSTLFAVAASRNAHEVTRKNAELLKANARSKVNLRYSDLAVDTLLTEVSEDPGLLAGTPGTQVLRKRLLNRAMQFYEDLLQQNPASGLDPQLGRAHLRLGIIHDQLGESAKALQHFTDAWELFDELAHASPQDSEAEFLVASAQANLARFHLAQGQPDTALPLALQARDDLAERHRSLPDEPSCVSELVSVLLTLGGIYLDKQDFTASEDHYREALRLAQSHDGPTGSRHRAQIASGLHDLGLGFFVRGDYRQALDLYDRSLRVFEQVEPLPHWQRERMRVLQNQAIALQKQGQTAEAQKAYEAAAELGQMLVQDNPLLDTYRLAQADVLEQLAELYGHHGQQNEGRKLHERADLLRRGLKNRRNSEQLARDYLERGSYYLNRSQPQEAESWFQRAIDTLQTVPPDDRDDINFRDALAKAHTNQGIVYAMTRQSEQAVASFRESQAILERLVTDYPQTVGFRVSLGGNRINLGATELERGNFDAALGWLNQGIDSLEQVLQVSADDANAALFLERARNAKIDASAKLARQLLGDPSVDGAAAERAVRLAHTACELTNWSQPGLLELLAAAHADCGDFPSALRWQQKAVELAEPADVQRLQARLDDYERAHRERSNKDPSNRGKAEPTSVP